MPTKLSDIGEFGLIELLKKYKGAGAAVIKGIGDDAAVVPWTRTRCLLFTADMLVEGVHFDLKAAPRMIGHKALACSISDIAAMGGVPRYALVSLGISPGVSTAVVRGIYKGMDTLARKFKVAIVGGDTVKSAKVIINITIAGEGHKKAIVYRRGARPGNRIFVTGPLGKSLLSGRHLKFIPRVKESQYLIRHFRPTAMIDISDGLVVDLGHILKESRVGARLDQGEIPCRKGACLENALYDGEDFELLFTLSRRRAEGLFRQRKFVFYPIGEIVRQSQGLRIKDLQGRLKAVKAGGYIHF